MALETLAKLPGLVPKSSITNTISFLLETQNPEGYWESYWWRSKYFATTRIIQQFHYVDNPRLRRGILRALNWLTQSSNIDGYWNNGYDSNIPCPLSTAHCVRALLEVGFEQKELICRSIRWLLEQQNTDGSWEGIPMLQIPPPHVSDPVQVVWKLGGRGVGSCCLDEKRIYTTSTVANIMHRFVLRLG